MTAKTHLLAIYRRLDFIFAERALKIFVGSVMGILGAFVFIGVLFRYVLALPLPWVEELSLLAMLWLGFMGAVLGTREAGHIRVDLLPGLISRHRRLFLSTEILSDLGGMGFSVVLFWWSIGSISRSLEIGNTLSSIRIPFAVVEASMAAGGLFMAVYFLIDLIRKANEAVGL